MIHVETGVIFGKIGITAIAEDTLNEVEVGNEIAGGEEAHFHASFFGNAGNFGTNDRAEKERDEDFGGRLAGAGEWKDHDVLGRVERGLEETGESLQRDFFFIGGNREAALGDMEDALGGAPVGSRVVAYALMDAVGTQDGGFEFILIGREGKHAPDTVALQDEGSGRDEGGGVVVEEIGKVIVNGLVDGAEVVGKETGLFLEGGEKRATEIEEGIVSFITDDFVAPGGEFKIDEFAKAFFFVGRGNGGALVGESNGVFKRRHEFVGS
jgi:hypothetical protein